MNITKDKKNDKTIIRLDGRLDAVTVPQVEDALNAEIEGNHLLIDFGKVYYLSSAGMRLLLSLSKRMKSKNCQFIIFSLQDDVKEIIQMAGFESVITIYSDEQAALSAQ